jgi:hypothetical protein
MHVTDFKLEKYPHKIAILTDTLDTAREITQDLGEEIPITDDVVSIVSPYDSAISRKLEPDARGVLGTIVKAHIYAGTIGTLIGFLLAATLLLAQVAIAVSHPWLFLIILSTVGLLVGLIIGGAVSIRPDQLKLMVDVQEASTEGGWSIVVHSSDRTHVDSVRRIFERYKGQITETL